MIFSLNLFFNNGDNNNTHNDEQDSMNLFSFTNSKNSFDKDYEHMFQHTNNDDNDNDIFWHNEEPLMF